MFLHSVLPDNFYDENEAWYEDTRVPSIVMCYIMEFEAELGDDILGVSFCPWKLKISLFHNN